MAEEQTPIAPPKTGIFSVRVAVWLAQLIISAILTLLIHRSLVSAEIAEKLKASPQYQVFVQILADGIAMLFVFVQGWVATHFFKVSGQIAQTKIEQIGAVNMQIAASASPPPSPPPSAMEPTSSIKETTE